MAQELNWNRKPEPGTALTRTESRTGAAGTIFPKLKLEPYLSETVLKFGEPKNFLPEELPELKTGNAPTVPCPNNNANPNLSMRDRRHAPTNARHNNSGS